MTDWQQVKVGFWSELRGEDEGAELGKFLAATLIGVAWVTAMMLILEGAVQSVLWILLVSASAG